MKMRLAFTVVCVVGALLAHPVARAETSIGTAFTYQGLLKDSSGPVTDTCDFKFSLWTLQTGGTQMGTTQTVPGVSVDSGLFDTKVDFGPGIIRGDECWLEVEVQCPGDTGYSTLSPRIEMTPGPHTLALDGLWTEQNTTSPNLIGGYSDNSVAGGVTGATIGGGGYAGAPNSVTANYATIGGGSANSTGGEWSTVSGGGMNDASAEGTTIGGGAGNSATARYSTVGGGAGSTTRAYFSTVGGGTGNTASGFAATVGGGETNSATVDHATVGGGDSNSVIAEGGTIGGGKGAGGGFFCDSGLDFRSKCGRCGDSSICAYDGDCASGPCTLDQTLCAEPGVCVTTSIGNRVVDNFGTVGGGSANQAGHDDGDPNGLPAAGGTSANTSK